MPSELEQQALTLALEQEEQEEQEETCTCTSCGNDYPESEMTHQDRSRCCAELHLCESCLSDYSTCIECGNLFPGDFAHLFNEEGYCQYCYHCRFSTCESCGETFNRDDLDSNGYCETCQDSEDEDDTGVWEVHDYNFKPVPRFFGKSHTGLFFGLEWETQRTRELLYRLEAMSEWYAKTDSSIGEEGIEFVSHPMSLQYIRENWDSLIMPIAKLANFGARSWNGGACGFHIHTSEGAWSHMQVFKVTRFFANHPRYVLKISGRASLEALSRWAAIDYDNPNNGSSGLAYKAMHKGTGELYGSRYLALNLNNKNTIEFRLFRGTLKPERIAACIEFVQALFDYTLVSPISFTSADFEQFTRQHKKDYPAFVSFHKLIAESNEDEES